MVRKKIISLIMILCFIFSVVSNVFTVTVSADSTDDAIRARIDLLYGMIGNTYFNVSHSYTGCGTKHSNHYCDECYTPNIVKAQWFINKFGYCSTSNFANSYGDGTTYSRAGWSCLGFANFAEWFIFKQSDGGQVNTTKIGTYASNLSNYQTYAKVGDEIRFGNSHSAIYISADANGVYVLDSNWSGTGFNCCVQKHYVSFGYTSTFTIARATNRAPAQETPVDPPSNCWVNINKGAESTYTVNETVNITYHAENVKYYIFEIYKDGASYECTETYYGECNRTFSQPGRYNAVVTAVNNGGRVSSGWISWNVVSAPAPSNCYISIDKGPESTYNVSETVNFTYHAENVKYYIFEIYKDGASYECTETYYGQCSRTFTQPGRYNSVVTAVGDGGRTSSGWISWNVVDPSTVGPNVPYVAVNNRNVFPQEQFRINFWAETAKYYNVKITKNGVAYKDEILYYGYYDTVLSEPGDYSIQVTAINDYGSSSAYDGVKVIGTVPEEPIITTAYDCYGINEDVEIMLTAGKYTQTSYMTIRKCTDVWETVFSGSVTDLTTKTYRFETAGYYQIEYQNSNIYGASPCAAKAIRIYDSAPNEPVMLLDKSIYDIDETITVTLLPGINARSAYMSVYNNSDELVFSQDVSGKDTQVIYFDTAGEYKINYQSANTFGQSSVALLPLIVGKYEMNVSLDANGGVLDETNKTVLRDSPYGKLPIPKCKGKKFIGWYTKAENGELIESDTIVTALYDHTLYAVWQTLPSTETTIIKKSNYSVVNITVHNLDEAAKVVLATYKNGILSDIQIEEYNGEDLSLATFLPYDTVKVMIWENMGSMRPLCESEVLH